jgi:hypothetical protein
VHLEIVQALRCPRPHEASWLVARTDRMDARHIVRGVLGCPVCGAEYSVLEGTARLGDPVAAAQAMGGAEDTALRAAALLGLTTPNGLVVLAGAWAAAAVEVAALADSVHVLAVNATGAPPPPGLGVSRLESASVIPLGVAVARGIAVDAAHASPEALDAAAEALGAGGRLLAPTGTAVPDTLAELARDDRWWVAEKAPAAPVVQLAGRRGLAGR